MKIIFFSLFLLISTGVHSQVGQSQTKSEMESALGRKEIGSATVSGYHIADFFKDEELGTYTIRYHNAEYRTITDYQSLSFKASEDDIDYLFNEILKAYKTDEPMTIRLGEQEVMFKRFMKKSMSVSPMGQGAVGFFYIDAQRLHNLFGKPFDKKAWKNYLKQ